jgi:crossover junction endodeoxyribonuclease RuvC
MPMKIVGIDPGTARMGYSVLKVNKTNRGHPRVLETDVIITKPELDMHKRLRVLYKGVNSIVRQHSPDIMVVEKLFFNTNAKTAISVGQARGVAMLAAANKNMPVYEYTALEAKLILAGYGRADKKQMQEAVKDILGLDDIIKSDDANDAIAIALCFIKKDLGPFLSSL